MWQVIAGVRAHIRAYPDNFREGRKEFVGKSGVLRLAGPLAMSEIVRRHPHLHSHILVDGFSKLGVDFYALRTCDALAKENAAGIGGGKKQYSNMRTRT
eukprot:5747332-Pyramimonas_sp.AAC.1